MIVADQFYEVFYQNIPPIRLLEHRKKRNETNED